MQEFGYDPDYDDLSQEAKRLIDDFANKAWGSVGSSASSEGVKLNALGIPLLSGPSWVLGSGFWGSPQDVLYPVDTNHETFVAEHPEMFSLPPGEVPSVEAALDSGWVRIRFHTNGVEIDLSASGSSRSHASRVKAIAEDLVAKGNNFTGKTINVGVDERPGITLTLEQVLSGDWGATNG